MLDKNLLEIKNRIKPGFKVLDVGGAVNTFYRANYVIDFLPFSENYPYYGGTEKYFSKDTWIEYDICKGNWPFKDKEFDFVVCSHVLEDIRDPLRACEEMIRVGKTGYIETPSRLCESTTGIARHYLAGFAHHRWFVEIDDNKMVFSMKHHKIHNWSYSFHLFPFFTLKNAFANTYLFWKDAFAYEENYPRSWKNYLKDFKKTQSLRGKTRFKYWKNNASMR